MKAFLSKYKFIIIINLIIFITYVLISSTPNLFGIDDLRANTRIFFPDLTIWETIKWISGRFLYWNSRLGELIYFIVGCFPRWVYFLIDGILMISFLNLVYVFTFGVKSKKFFLTKNYYISILINYLITLYLFPGFSETMIWMAGVFNHLFSVVICLIACIPFRLLMDDYDFFENRSKKIRIFYYILCGLAAFTVENVVPWLLAYMFIIIIANLKKEFKRKWTIIALIIVFVSFLCFVLLNSTKNRVDYFISTDWAKKSIIDMADTILTYFQYLFYVFFSLIFVNIFVRKKNYKQYKFLMSQLFFSLISLLVIYLSPYFVFRTTLLFYFFMLTVITFLTNNIIFNDKYISIVVVLTLLYFTFLTTYNLIIFYKDFNDFNKKRYEYIMERKTFDTLSCPMYDNKKKYFFFQRLVTYETLYCDSSYVYYITGRDDNPEVSNVYDISIR